MKRPQDLPYRGTKVSVRDTISNIKELLHKYGLIGHQITEYGKTFRLVFALEKDNKKFAFQFELTRPEEDKFDRQKFRAFYWHLKSRLEAVDFGLFTLQEIFMQKCGDPIDVLGHMARVVKFRNNMCLRCTIDIVKEEELVNEKET